MLPPSSYYVLYILLFLHLLPNSCHSTIIQPRSTYLLPNHVTPYRYQMYLDVHFKPDFVYFGSETISVRVQVPTSEITLHADRNTLNISICSISPATEFHPKSIPLNITHIYFDDRLQQMTLRLNQILEPNENYQIYFEFAGSLNQVRTDGLYVLKYGDPGRESYVASTVFEPNLARKVFPCFDEPHYKSYFSLMIRRPHNMETLSNMPLEKTSVDGDSRIDHFQESMLMSPYLLCFAVGSFDSITTWNNGVQYRVFQPHNNTHTKPVHYRVTPQNGFNSLGRYKVDLVRDEPQARSFLSNDGFKPADFEVRSPYSSSKAQSVLPASISESSDQDILLPYNSSKPRSVHLKSSKPDQNEVHSPSVSSNLRYDHEDVLSPSKSFGGPVPNKDQSPSSRPKTRTVNDRAYVLYNSSSDTFVPGQASFSCNNSKTRSTRDVFYLPSDMSTQKSTQDLVNLHHSASNGTSAHWDDTPSKGSDKNPIPHQAKFSLNISTGIAGQDVAYLPYNGPTDKPVPYKFNISTDRTIPNLVHLPTNVSNGVPYQANLPYNLSAEERTGELWSLLTGLPLRGGGYQNTYPGYLRPEDNGYKNYGTKGVYDTPKIGMSQNDYGTSGLYDPPKIGTSHNNYGTFGVYDTPKTGLSQNNHVTSGVYDIPSLGDTNGYISSGVNNTPHSGTFQNGYIPGGLSEPNNIGTNYYGISAGYDGSLSNSRPSGVHRPYTGANANNEFSVEFDDANVESSQNSYSPFSGSTTNTGASQNYGGISGVPTDNVAQGLSSTSVISAPATSDGSLSPETLESLTYFLTTSVKLVDYFERQFGIMYKLPKQDLLFLPGFQYEALENWGLVSVNSRYHLTNSSDLSHKVLGSRLLAHELSHNWFGNLVSVKHWSHVWVNEGLANFYTAMGLDYLEPGWKFGPSYAARSMRIVMKLESQPRKALPLNLTWDDGHTPLFNHAVYEKSFCVLRMINYTLGEKVFTKAIQNYLSTYQFRSTTADDLLDIIDQTYNEQNQNSGRETRNLQGTDENNEQEIRTNKELDQNNEQISHKKLYENKEQKSHTYKMPDQSNQNNFRNVVSANLNTFHNWSTETEPNETSQINEEIPESGELNRREDQNNKNSLVWSSHNSPDPVKEVAENIETLTVNSEQDQLNSQHQNLYRKSRSYNVRDQTETNFYQTKAFQHHDDQTQHQNTTDTNLKISSDLFRVASGGDSKTKPDLLEPTKTTRNNVDRSLYPEKSQRNPRIQTSNEMSSSQNATKFGDGVSLKTKLRSWVSNPGYPLVKVIRGYESGQLFITQERFQKPGPSKVTDNTKWWIPLTWFTQPMNSSKSGPDVSTTWFSPTEEMLVLTTRAKADEWILFNHEFSGLYSVVYDAQNYALLSSYLNSVQYSDIPSLSRVQLLSDLVLFTKYKLLAEDILFNHLKYFQHETDPLVWTTLSGVLKEVTAIFNDSVYWKDFQDLMSNISPIRSDQFAWSFDKVQSKHGQDLD